VDECIFCAIVAGKADATVVAQDERTVAFLDIAPLTRGHTLVVPRAHSPDLLHADPEDVAAVARAAQRVAAAALPALGAAGVNLLQANGAVAMQSVFHLHVHVIPRYRPGEFHIELGRRRAEPAELAEVGAALRQALSG
jgi:histidine triad (HIT) family protein